MKNYKVVIKRVEHTMDVVEVTANNFKEAEKLATEILKTHEFSGNNIEVEYLTEGVMEIKSEEDQFWEIIKKVNWKKDHSYKRIADELSILPKDFKAELKKFCNTKLSELNSKFEQEWLKPGKDGIECSDDGWYDLCADVVGRGRDFYYSVTKEKLQKMAIELDYRENFFYSFQD